MALPHAYGRLQFGADLDLHFRTIIGTGRNPNVAACVVIGIEPEWTKQVVDAIAATGKPVEGFAIEQNGDIATVARRSARRQGVRPLGDARSSARRCGIEELWAACKCGESDTTTGLASCPTVGNFYDKLIPQGIYGCFGETSEITGGEDGGGRARRHAGGTGEVPQDLAGLPGRRDRGQQGRRPAWTASRPRATSSAACAPSRRRPSATSRRSARKCRYIDVLEPAEAPAKGPGLYFMDTSSAAAECCTLQAAAGYVVHMFPTGQGNVIGNPIMPVIKISGNPRTVRTMSEHIDLDVTGVLRREMTLRRGRRRADRHGDPHLQRPGDRGRGAGPPRVRDDQALPQRLMLGDEASQVRRRSLAGAGRRCWRCRPARRCSALSSLAPTRVRSPWSCPTPPAGRPTRWPGWSPRR